MKPTPAHTPDRKPFERCGPYLNQDMAVDAASQETEYTGVEHAVHVVEYLKMNPEKMGEGTVTIYYVAPYK